MTLLALPVARPIFGLFLILLVAGCSGSSRVGCQDAEGFYLNLPQTACSEGEDRAACESRRLAIRLEAVEALALEPWEGSRNRYGHARYRCWYDQEQDPIAEAVENSIAVGARTPEEWLQLADATRHDAVRATVLLSLSDAFPEKTMPRLLAALSGDGVGLDESVIRELAFTRNTTTMAAVIAAFNRNGYPEDGLMGAFFWQDQAGWSRAVKTRYAKVRWPTYWLLGIDAPEYSTVLDRVRERWALERAVEEISG
jgi:hypothetical protein